MRKRPLISESVVVIQIGVHPTGEKTDNILHAGSCGLHVQQPSVKSLLAWNWAPAPEMKSWFPTMPDSHSGLPRYLSIKSPWSREVWFDKVDTKLLSLSGPIKVWHGVSTVLNFLTGAKTTGLWQNHLISEGFITSRSIRGFSMQQKCTNMTQKHTIPCLS
jgi:hypothetical protein